MPDETATTEVPTGLTADPPVADLAADPAADPAAAPAADPLEGMTPGDQGRQAIFAKAMAARAAPSEDESVNAQADAIARMANREDEPAPVTVATPAGERTIRVDGQDVVVSQADIERAGVATLQRQTATELGLERARKAESDAVELRAELQRKLDEANKVLSAAPPGKGAQAASGHAAPSTDAPNDPEAVEALRQAQEALLDGDLGKAAALQNTIITASVAKALAAAGKPAAGSPASAAAATAAGQWDKDARVEANEYFADAFSDVHNDPQRSAYARQRMQAEMADPANRGLDLTKIVRLVGREARQLPIDQAARPSAPTGASVPGAQPISRRVLKERISVLPSGGTDRGGSSVPAGATDKPQSNGEYVQQLRRSRGLPV